MTSQITPIYNSVIGIPIPKGGKKIQKEKLDKAIYEESGQILTPSVPYLVSNW